MIILGIGGEAGAGKDTVADFLVKEYGFIKIAFGDKLKELIHHYYNIPEKELWCSSKSKEVRRILQGTGQMIREINGDQFWIREVEKKILYETLTKGCSYRFVISDIRYRNEMDFVKSFKGYTWEIERKEIDHSNTNMNHISERGIREGWDLHIMNNGTITELGFIIKKEIEKIIHLGLNGV